MIPEQLDLFGGPPRPPKRIREEEPDTTPAMPEQKPEPDTIDSQMTATSLPAPTEMPMETAAVVLPEQPTADDDPMPEWIAAPNQPPADDSADATITEATAGVTENTQPMAAKSVSDAMPETAPVSEVIAWMAPAPIRHIAPASDTPQDEPADPFIEPVSDIVVEFPASKKVTAHTDAGAPAHLHVPPDEELFKRQYYSMRETAAMFDISHSMLRYWENEFEVLQPRKNRKGDRYFRPIDIKHLQLIYHLLKVRRFTIEGAREYLRNHNKALDTFELIKKLEKLKSFLLELKANVS